ncbi:DUF6950 family protein [Sphingomonas hylomeconis]|uniref:DUF6950 family protein n=1 Tax=Sphingomonas hylomeconis TaxID=1395958 RepID=A0ABV7SQ87_9SPHN|nr:hypothetical protein [Sphingomonas hylomeconis]
MVRDYDALLGFIADRRDMPFAWGRHANDCASFAAGAVLAQTGRDVIGSATWSSRVGALRVAQRLGGLPAIVTARLTEIAPAMAQRGDVAGVADDLFPGGIRLMVVEGVTLVGPAEQGTERQQRAAMIRAWSVDA